MAFLIEASYQIFPKHTILYLYLQFIGLFCNFVTLIEKDGGTGPCEVLATCAYKVLQST
jgi:hypothetical protein